MTLENQLQQILDIKQDIKTVLTDKGIETGDDFSTYASKIQQVQSGSGSSFNLFDTKLVDHILEGNEGLGWALQGTFVYKTDYPDFYAKCLEEYTESVKVKHANIIKVGNINEDDCVLNGFSTGNYAKIPTKINLGNNFEILVKVTTPQDWSKNQAVLCGSGTQLFAMACFDPNYPNKFSYNIGDGSDWLCDETANHGNTTLEPNTVYYVKMTLSDNVYTSFISTDGNNWIQDWTFNSTIIIPQMDMLIGVGRTQTTGFYEGALDISEWYIKVNGEYIWQNCTYNKHANGHMFYPIGNKPVIDTLFNTTGMAWMYGIDQENERVFLPRNNWFEQAGDILEVGQSVEAGLPNIEGSFSSPKQLNANFYFAYTSGAFYSKGQNGASNSILSPSGLSTAQALGGFNASRSNSIYGNSDTVQPNAVKKLLYICVGNTVQGEAIIDISKEVELNNPFSLLDYKYSEYELNNLSWLRSNGQYNSKAIYPAVYDLLLKIYNGTETKAGASVKLSTDESATEYDFRINTVEETFMLPTKVKLAGGKAIAGNGMALGLSTGAQNFGLFTGYNSGYGYGLKGKADAYGQAICRYVDGQLNEGIAGIAGVTSDPTKSGMETSDSGLYLYFYVGETVQNAHIIDAGKIQTQLIDKLETDLSNLPQESKSYLTGLGLPSEKYIDLELGATGTVYTAPADGYVVFAKVASQTGTLVQLYVPSTALSVCSFPSVTHHWGYVTLPIRKGQQFITYYTATGETKYFRFIYAQGA